VDLLMAETAGATDETERLAALLAQLDSIPDRADASDPLEWDEDGLPK
jgi:antitoxin VapB